MSNISFPVKALLTSLILTGLLFAVTFVYTEIKLAPSQKPLSLQRLSGNYTTDKKVAYFQSTSLPVPPQSFDTDKSFIMGDNTPEPDKRIEVDLTNQRLYAYEDGYKVMDFLVSTGKWGRTPTGEFDIWIKLRYTTMSGGSKALNTYYYLPNVPYTMFFYNKDYPKWVGYGIHGTYWHDNFGHPMSHGCINMKNEDVEQLYYWARPELPDGKKSVTATAKNPGTKVYIYGVAPKE